MITCFAQANQTKSRTSCPFEISIPMTLNGPDKWSYEIVNEDPCIVGAYKAKVNCLNTGLFYPIWENRKINCECLITRKYYSTFWKSYFSGKIDKIFN